MSAAETIAAAIERLETIQRDGVWTYSPENMDIIANATTVALGVMPPDGDRIVMLHRTIDAQLAILRTGMRLVTAFPDSEWTNTVNLATAILGEAS